MHLSYHIPQGVSEKTHHGHPALSTKQGGLILLDSVMLEIWRSANGKALNEMLASSPAPDTSTIPLRAALACLAEADLLEREQEYPSSSYDEIKTGPLVSVVLVSYNSQPWLKICLPSLSKQNYTPYEIILVDNGSTDDSVQWVSKNFPAVKLVTLEKTRPLSKAINCGVTEAKGEFYLLLNPDLKLSPDAIANMVSSINGDQNIAAVAPKLKLMWAPAFLNGLGNFVGSISWGTDIGLGHLDLGQFENWTEVPSACFAATLISASVWNAVGPVDEGFPLYYEDSEWCYRARQQGYTIRAAPDAVIYHAFGSRTSLEKGGSLTPEKLQYVSYGRLRFAVKLLSRSYLIRFLSMYFLEDSLNTIYSIMRGRWKNIRAYFRAWTGFLNNLSLLRNERKHLQEQRKKTDRDLFTLQKKIPMPLIRYGFPLLTWDLVLQTYLPLFVGSQGHILPEFEEDFIQAAKNQTIPVPALLNRLTKIYKVDGIKGLLFRIGRLIQWKLIHP
ncbi:glycosyltransferase family 2 protein [Chloroflexota bacterium]